MILYPLRVHAVAAAAGLALAAHACGGDTSGPSDSNGGTNGPVQATAVDVIDNSFRPANIGVNAGQTVSWTWRGSNEHSVSFDDPSIGSSSIKRDGGFQRTFNGTGRFTYYCTVHGRAIMSGEVIVE